MIIQKLKLKNFGRHRDLDVSPSANVVGLLGDNGSGKSTVLEAVQFAITGESPLDQESYVTFGEDNGSVELTFVRHGQVGKIFRQVGKTPKRVLEWEGKQIKSAKEVEEILASIFGADKRAVSAAVFIPQGDLQNLLFGAQAERETLFIRLVNLAFCEQVAKIIDGKIKKVGSTVADLTAVTDMARALKQQAEAAVTAARSGLDGLSNLQSVVFGLQARCNIQTQKSSSEAALRDSLERRVSHSGTLTQFLATRGFVGVDAVKLQLSLLDTMHVSTVRDVDRITKGISGIESRKHLRTQLIEQRAATAKLMARADDLSATFPADPEKVIAEKNQQSKDAVTFRQLSSTIGEFEAASERNIQELNSLVEPHHADRIEELVAAVAAQKSMLAQNRLWLKRQEELQKCMGKIIEGRCKDCGLNLSPEQDFDAAALTQFRHAIQVGETDLAIKEAEGTKLLGEVSGYLSKKSNLERNQIFMSEQLYIQQTRLQAVAYAKSFDPDALASEAGGLQKLCWEFSTLQVSRVASEAKAKQIEDQIAAYTDLDENQLSQEKLTAAQSQRDSISHQIRDLRVYSAEVTRLESEIRTTEHQITIINDQIAAYEKAIEELPLSAEETRLFEKFNDVALVQAELHSRHDAWLRQNGVLIEANRALVDAAARLKELDDRAAQDVKRRTCLNRLHELKVLMSRQGLPGKYVAHRFTQLAVLTQTHLTRMASGFDVSIDPEVPLSFRFKRQDDGADLPMTKLSGGQRVRLSLAFLMAVQEALVPDVGLLVLDEPSMHLDVAGKASLAELLMDTGRRLSQAESQVWISDHAIELEPAFGATVRL